MKLVIDIPDKAFKNLQFFKDGSLSRPEIAVKYGTPLEAQPIHGSTYGGVSWGGIYKGKAQSTDAVSRHILVNLEDIIRIYSDKKKTNALNGDDDAFIEAVRKCQKFQPCEDAVSREQVEEITFQEPSYTDPYNILTEVREKIRALPPVQPQRKRGKWIFETRKRLVDETDDGLIYREELRCKCGACGADFGFQKVDDKFCKYCGSYNAEGGNGE